MQNTRQHQAADTDMRGKGGYVHAKVIKPARQQLSGVCGVVHVYAFNR
jgi:hypothetical protein